MHPKTKTSTLTSPEPTPPDNPHDAAPRRRWEGSSRSRDFEGRRGRGYEGRGYEGRRGDLAVQGGDRERSYRHPWDRKFNEEPDAPVAKFSELMTAPSALVYDQRNVAERIEDIEQVLHVPQLSEEKDKVLKEGQGIKLWVEGLPTANHETLQKALDALRTSEHPIRIRHIEPVYERGMVPTLSAFLIVDFGPNDLEQIFYKVENFGLSISGIRCPVRTAEVKRTLIISDVPQLSEEELVGQLAANNIRYLTYDYPLVYNSPQRKISRPYKGKVTLTFDSHQSAYSTKEQFDSETGVSLGGIRTYAEWGSRMGAKPIEVRTAANYMRNLVWENRDLRRYVRELRAENPAGLREPTGFEKFQHLVGNDAQQGERPRISSLDELSRTRTISAFVPKIDDNMTHSEISNMFEEKISAMVADHKEQVRRLKQERDSWLRKITNDVFVKNHRSKQTTADELGISTQRVSKDTRLKPAKKKRKKVVVKKAVTSGEGEEGAVEEGEEGAAQEGEEGAVQEGEEGAVQEGEAQEGEEGVQEGEAQEGEEGATQEGEAQEGEEGAVQEGESQEGEVEAQGTVHEGEAQEGEELVEGEVREEVTEGEIKEGEEGGLEAKEAEPQEGLEAQEGEAREKLDSQEESGEKKEASESEQKNEKKEKNEDENTTEIVDATGRTRKTKVIDW